MNWVGEGCDEGRDRVARRCPELDRCRANIGIRLIRGGPAVELPEGEHEATRERRNYAASTVTIDMSRIANSS